MTALLLSGVAAAVATIALQASNQRASGETDRWRVTGDVKLRHESNVRLTGAPERHRQLVRFRLAARYRLTDEVTWDARVRTGDPEQPNTPLVVLGRELRSLELNLDRLAISYRPSGLPGVEFVGGKFGHPFQVNSLYGELVWDADLSPEGIAAAYRTPEPSRGPRLQVVLGAYSLLERKQAEEALAMTGQIGLRLNPARDWEWSIALGYYHYDDPPTAGAPAFLERNAGNATRDRDGDGTVDAFASDFAVVNPITTLTYTGARVPISVSGEWMYNRRAAPGEGRGGAAWGLAAGASTGAPWRVYYQWQRVGRDAVFSPMTGDDFLLRVNHRSPHRWNPVSTPRASRTAPVGVGLSTPGPTW